jgi:hypothetical protein
VPPRDEELLVGQGLHLKTAWLLQPTESPKTHLWVRSCSASAPQLVCHFPTHAEEPRCQNKEWTDGGWMNNPTDGVRSVEKLPVFMLVRKFLQDSKKIIFEYEKEQRNAVQQSLV